MKRMLLLCTALMLSRPAALDAADAPQPAAKPDSACVFPDRGRRALRRS